MNRKNTHEHEHEHEPGHTHTFWLRHTLGALLAVLLALSGTALSCAAQGENAPTVALSGIQLRLSEPWGFRFLIRVSGTPSDYTEVGAAVLPTDRLNGALTEETAGASVVSSRNDNFRYFSQSADGFVYTVCIIGIDFDKFDRSYEVMSYVRCLENGEEKTFYGENSAEYRLPVSTVSEELLKQYCDRYTRDELSDITAIETLLSGYYAYVDEQNADPEEPEKPDEPEEEIARVTLNDWYFETGTIAGSTGVENTANKTRAYTPNYIPAENTVLSFDSTGGGAYGVLCYDQNKKFLGTCYGTGSWITDSVYNKNGAAFSSETAYYRLAVKKTVNGRDLTVTDDNRAEIVSPLTVQVPLTDRKTHTFLRVGDLSPSDGCALSAGAAYSSAYIPTDVRLSAASGADSFALFWYDENRAFLSTSGLLSAFPSEIPENAAYFRFAVYPDSAATADTLNDIAAPFGYYTAKVLNNSDFALGTISGTTGKENTSAANRLYTPEYIPAKNCVITLDKANLPANFSRYIVLAYKADYSFIGTSGDRLDAVFDAPAAFSDATFYRLAIKTNSAVTTDTIAETVSALRVECRTELLAPNVEEEVATDDTPIMTADGFRFRLKVESFKAGTYFSDLCLVEDELWLFSCSDKASDGSNTGTILRYSVDFENQTGEYIGSLSHNFGHANSIDYNSETHALTFGNGSGSFSKTENYFYIYENPYEKVKAGEDMLNLADAVKYDFADSGLTGKTKINACFYGSASLLLNANNNGFVYRVALGTGDRVLSYGTALSAPSENGFNGTWDIIRSYEMPDNGAIDQAPAYIGQNYEQCNQGTAFHNGSLYLACGHKAVYFWRCRLNPDGSITRHEFRKYLTMGATTVTSGAAGVAFAGDNRLFVCVGWVHVYDEAVLKAKASAANT